MSSINKYFVSLFKLLNTTVEDSKYLKYATVYSRMDFNEKYNLNLLNNLKNNRGTPFENSIFKNIKSSQEDYNKMSDDNKLTFNKLLNGLEEELKNKIYNIQKDCEDDCGCCTSKKPSIMDNKKIKKIMKNNKMRNQLEKELSKQLGVKNANLETLLQETSKGGLQNNPLLNSLKGIIDEKTINNITETIFGDNDKFKTLLDKIMNNEKYKKDIDNIKIIFNEEKIKKIFGIITNKMSNLKEEDLMTIVSDVMEVEEVKDLYNNFQKSVDSGLLSIEKINELMNFGFQEVLTVLKEENLISDKQINRLTTVVKYMNKEEKPERKISKEERKRKQRKKYKKQMKKQMKNKK
jgi:hypothetical protein